MKELKTKPVLLASLLSSALFMLQCASPSPSNSKAVAPLEEKRATTPRADAAKTPSDTKNLLEKKAGSAKKEPIRIAEMQSAHTNSHNAPSQEVARTEIPNAIPVPTGPTHSPCGATLPPANFSRADVYDGRPFQAGETAQYEVSYMGVHAGFGELAVEAPIKHDGVWHQVFSGSASTGEWYEKIVIVKDRIRTVSRPWDFAAAQFYIEQDEGSLFGRRFTQKKWIRFDQTDCKVFEKTENRKKEIKNDEYTLEPGANDALSAFFALRTIHFVEGRTERIPVYTSEKNWHLDATPVAFETLTVPAGTFKTVKLKLVTYLGKDLQQKGDVHLWLATDHPARPMVRVEAEVKVGKIQIKLQKFVEGNP